jgi:hypothetical protein
MYQIDPSLAAAQQLAGNSLVQWWPKVNPLCSLDSAAVHSCQLVLYHRHNVQGNLKDVQGACMAGGVVALA